jgi:hypothetical protein
MDRIEQITNFQQYDGTELSLVIEFTMPDGSRACEAMSTIEIGEVDLDSFVDPIVFYSVYLHLFTGGVECVADFYSLDDAQIYCHALDSILKF